MLETKNHAASEIVLDERDRDAIEIGLLQVLIKRQRFSSSTAFLGFGFMAWLMRETVPAPCLVGWVGCLVLLELLNLSLLGRLQKGLGALARRWRWRWLRGLTVLFFFYGAAWGSATVLPGLWLDALLLQVILVGTVAVALFSIHNLSAHWPMLLSFSMGGGRTAVGDGRAVGPGRAAVHVGAGRRRSGGDDLALRALVVHRVSP